MLGRCATRGRSWHYVLKALANEQPPTEAQTGRRMWADIVHTGGKTSRCRLHAVQRPSLRRSRERAGADALADLLGILCGTVQEAWEAAYQQLELQLDPGTFNSWLRDAVLVDFEPETATFVVAVRTARAARCFKGGCTGPCGAS